MKLSLKRFTFSVLLVLFFAASFAQSYRVTHYTKEDGLHSELTKSLTKDTLGFIWIASDDGLIKFNGYKFQQYKGELINPYVKDVTINNKGKLLILTDDGLMEASCSVNDVKFKTLLTNKSSQGDSLMWFPKQLLKLKSGAIWATDKSHVYHVQNNSIQQYKLPFKAYSHDWQRASALFENSDGTTFVISQPGYWFYIDSINKKLVEIETKNELAVVRDVVLLSPNKVMVSAKGFVYVCEIAGKELTSVRKVAKLNVSYFIKKPDGEIFASTWLSGLYQVVQEEKEDAIEGSSEKMHFSFLKISNNEVNSANHLSEGRDGSIWVTGDNGLFLLQEKNFTGVFANVTRSYIQCLEEDKQGNVFFSDGGRVFKVDKTRKKLYSHEVYRVKDKAILQVTSTDTGLWLGDSQGIITWLPNEGKEELFDFTKNGKAIFFMQADNAGNLWACQDGNEQLICLNKNNEINYYGSEKGITSRPIVARLTNSGKLYVGGTNDNGYLFCYDAELDSFTNLSKPLDFLHADQIVVNDIAFSDSSVWIGTSFGLLRYRSGVVDKAMQGEEGLEAIKFLGVDQDSTLWYANSNGLNKYSPEGSIVFDEGEGLPSKTLAYRCFLVDRDGDFWVGTVAGLARAKKIDSSVKTPSPFFVQVKHEGGSLDHKTKNDFFTDDFLNFQFVAPVFPSKSVVYEWRLSGADSVKWQRNEFNKEVLIAQFSPGNYIFEVRARQDGNYYWSDNLQYPFRITLVWYKRWWVWAIILVIIGFCIGGVVRYYTWNLNRQNELLEQVVKERTQEIKQSEERLKQVNEHLAFQTQALDESALVSMTDTNGIITYVNDKFCETSQYTSEELIGHPHSIVNSGYHSAEFFNEMWTAIRKGKWRGEFRNRAKDGSIYWVDATIVPFIHKDGEPYQYLAIRFDVSDKKKNEEELLKQKAAIELSNKHIRSSINYASRIQDAVLKTNNLLAENFSESFVYFRPKEVVSGDFYWVKQIGNKIVVAAADCTGHGVPGAFMSMLGIASLNEIVTNQQVTQPNLILEQLRDKIKTSLRQTGAIKEAKDGMDMSLCVFDLQAMEMIYSGANNPVYIIRDDAFINLEPTKNPVGVYPKEKPFKTETVQLVRGDVIYLFSDGYADQFCEEYGERFKRHRFKSLLLEHAKLPLVQQQLELVKAHNKWRGSVQQLDDMLIIGLQV